MTYSESELVPELLYGASFLDRFSSQLQQLRSDEQFVDLIASIRCRAAERFGSVLASEKRFAANELYGSGALWSYKALSEIVDGVKADGYTMTSALITTYIAMYLLDIDPGQSADSQAATPTPSIESSQSEVDFRLRWPAEYRCEDGHYVRSKNEAIVDNWLYNHGVCHAYEKSVFDPETGDTLCSDFYVPELDLYIEVWGMVSQEYAARRARKLELYQRLGCRLLQIDGDGVKIVDDVLSREFARYR